MVITSKSNPLVKKYASLKEKKFRKEYSLFLVEGYKMVKEVLNSPYSVEDVIVSSDYSGEKYVSDAIEVSPQVFSYLSDERTPQGILAVVRIPENRLSAPKSSCLLLDQIQDPGNMGTIIRTANAAGYREIYLIGCTDPYSPKSVRSAMSGLFFTNLYFGERKEVLSALKEYEILCADMDGENIFTFQVPEKFALAIGNEGNGISKEVFSSASHTVRIPMESTAESLNAGVSAGIAMYVLKSNTFKKI